MTISEMLNEIGNEHLHFQMLQECLVGNQKQKKGYVQITFAAGGVPLIDLVANEPSKVGMVIWIPGDKFRRLQAKIKAEKSGTP